MIIKKLEIENYLCYYDKSIFELSKGLNIIIGENGEGKTKFFEALNWLFEGDNKDLEFLISAKKLDEASVGTSFQVSVSIIVEQYGQINKITKSFSVKKEDENKCLTSDFKIQGISENNDGERDYVDGQALLDRVFPFQIRKYSMFKGEEELNIFENNNALINLINLFSEAKHYEKYAEKGNYLLSNATKAVEDSSKSDIKNRKAYERLEADIKFKNQQLISHGKISFKNSEEIQRIKENIKEVEKYVTNYDSLKIYNGKIKSIEEKIQHLNISIDENYTTALFDEKWLLVNFEKIQKQFADKISKHSETRRKLQSEHDIQKGKKIGVNELLNNAVPLPINVPSKPHIEEMLKDEICKVCNREAKVGSDPYEFMKDKLNTYLKSQMLENDDHETEKMLFKYDYTNRLEVLSATHEDSLIDLRLIEEKIQSQFEFNEERKKDIEDLEKKLEEHILDRDRITGKAGKTNDEIVDLMKYYGSWQSDLTDKNKDQFMFDIKEDALTTDLKKLNDEKEKFDKDSAQRYLVQYKNILKDILTIFVESKEKKFDQFIEKLQTKSNNFFKTINFDSFTGTIVFKRINNYNQTKIEVELHEGDRIFHRPNTSLSTSMYVSILFAISELASEIKEENFPMIFDAPTSSFGENKTAQFLNLIFKTENQKILLVKDFIHTDKKTGKLSIKNEFNQVNRDKAFWVKLERPFDPNELKTINSQVITL